MMADLRPPNAAVSQNPATAAKLHHVPTGSKVISLRFGARSFQNVKVMTYNVKNLFELSPHPSDRELKWYARRLELLGEVIKQENPDVVAFQEIHHPRALQDLIDKELNNQYKVIASTGTNDPRGMQVGMIYKKDLDLVETKSHVKDQVNGTPIFRRDLLEARFKFQDPVNATQDKMLTVFTSHFKSMRGGEKETHAERMREARGANAIIRNVMQQFPQGEVVMMGDLNSKMTSTMGRQVLSTLTDNPGQTTPLMHEAFEGEKLKQGTFRFTMDKLDYIFLSPNLTQKMPLEKHIVGDWGKMPWHVASDHLPIAATLNAQPTASTLPTPAAPDNVVAFASAPQPNKINTLA